MNILITGIHGFVGSNLVAALKEQQTIYGLDIVSPLKDGVVKTFGWNELEKLPEVDVIIHLAGKAHDTKNTSSAKDYFTINVGLTQTIFKHFLKSSATKFIYFSSVKAVADPVKGNQLTEDVLPDPQTPYGQSKLEAEQYILDQLRIWNLELGTWNKKLFILRPCMIHGPGNKGNLNLLFNMVQKGFPWPLGAYDNKRSFTSIDNLSYIIRQIIDKEIEPGIYQVADDEALSSNELFRLIAESQNRKPRIWNISGKLISLLARMGDFLHLPINSERLQKLTESYVVSNQKIKKALGIDQMPFSANDGLKKTLESFKG